MQLLHDNFYIDGQLTEADFIAAKEAGITLIINNRPDAEEPGILSVERAKSLAEENGMNYLHLPMANGQPLSPELIPSMKKALEEQNDEEGKILAHCRTGTRSSFLWGIVQIMEGTLNTAEVIQTAADAGINLAGFAPILHNIEQE